MPVHYDGRNLTVVFGAVDISDYIRSCTINESAPAPPEIDTTHSGDTARTHIEGLPGAVTTTVDIELLDIYDSLHAFGTQTINTQDTLIVYPYGSTHTYPMLTLQNARFHQRGDSHSIDNAAAMTGTFEAKNTVTRSTYSSA